MSHVLTPRFAWLQNRVETYIPIFWVECTNFCMQTFLPPIYHTSSSYKFVFTPKKIKNLKLVTERLIPSISSPAKTRGLKICLLSNVLLAPHISLSIISRIICIGISPSVRIASLFGSGLINNSVGNPRTWDTKSSDRFSFSL